MTGDGGALLLHKEGVVCAVGGLVLGGQDELAAEKPSEWSYSEVNAPLPKQRNRA